MVREWIVKLKMGELRELSNIEERLAAEFVLSGILTIGYVKEAAVCGFRRHGIPWEE